jgi:glycosyltransferase involved in cell wall biosynthesis
MIGGAAMDRAMEPLVSAVIPTRNRPVLVRRAVMSALNQSYSNLEVVVVVDGLDPITVEELQALAEPRLRVIALTENVGGSEARNIGVRESRGEWIALLDDDDEWFCDKIARQMSARPEGGPRHCLIACRCVARNQSEADVVVPRRFPEVNEDVSEYMFYSSDGQHHACGPQTSGYVGTRELFLDVPFAKGLPCHQDWDWYLRAMRDEATVAVMMEEPLYILHVETQRPRMTQVARWQLSLEWVESRRALFTPRAYTSFLINECMYRCDERRNRAQVFRELLSRCRKSASFSIGDLLMLVKWYVFRPSRRMALRGFIKRVRAGLGGMAAGSHTLEPPTGKQEAHG